MKGWEVYGGERGVNAKHYTCTMSMRTTCVLRWAAMPAFVLSQITEDLAGYLIFKTHFVINTNI